MTVHSALRAWPREKRDALRLALWTSDEIAAATGGVASGAFQCAGVEIDSRDVRSGDLFVALKGEATDGHRFIDKAFANGSAAALVSEPVDWPHILVADTTDALAKLAAASRARAGAVRIGVTGSVGKTGVKEAIFAALDRASRGAAHRSVRSYNNHVGVPLSLARMPARSTYGVFEMGMNQAGEILGLTAQVRPHVAVITTIAPAHIENLGSEEIAYCRVGEATVVARGAKPIGVREGDRVTLTADRSDLHLFDRTSGRRLEWVPTTSLSAPTSDQPAAATA